MDVQLSIDNHHLEDLGASPRTAILELIWNGLDADAERLEVTLAEQEMGGVDEIRVADNGHGMTHEEARASFDTLGGSWKQQASQSRDLGRALHGKSGKGRFRAASLGRLIRWETVAEANSGRELTVIEIHANDLRRASISDAKATEQPVGTRVVVSGFTEPPLGLGEGTGDYLLSRLAPYLQKYRPQLIYAGETLETASIQTGQATYELETEDAGKAGLEVIEWNRAINRVLCLCTESGMALREEKVGIQAPGFEFTAYVSWGGFEDENRILTPELDPQSVSVIEAARDQLRTHFKDRSDDERRRQVEEWKSEHVYPFEGEATTTTERASRDFFDVVAVTARDAVNAGEAKSKKLTLGLLKTAIEQDPGSLRRVMNEVLDLSEQDLAELNKLLDRTSLSQVISASRTITNRLDFLLALEEMVLDPEKRKRVLERSQLHRILAGETWIFGEEFALTADDESLNSVLRKHVKRLGRDRITPDVLDEPVEDISGGRKQSIVDLLLARQIPQTRNRLEHLVIELKRPTVPIGNDEAQQIKDYALAVAEDDRFDKADVDWDFIAVSTKLAGTIPEESRQEGKPAGLLTTFKQGRVRVWARTWGEIIEETRHRHKFVKEKLDYAPSTQQAFKYLEEAHAEFLPEDETSASKDSASERTDREVGKSSAAEAA
jgi:hypothetical protein